MSSYDPHQGFDWSSKESVVVPEQAATAVYINPHDDIVIRQKGDPYEDEHDHWFILAPNNALRLAYAIIDLVKELEGVVPALPAPALSGNAAPKDRTAAERQRRRRNKQWDTVTVTDANRDADVQTDEEAPLLLMAAE